MKRTQWSIAYTTSGRLLFDYDGRYVVVSNTDELVELARKHTRLPLEVDDYTDQVDIFTRGADGRRRKLVTFFCEGAEGDDERLVFVYGTLKRGYWNNELITKTGGQYVDAGTTVRPMYMQDGGFPYVYDIEADVPKAPITGEVWRVSDACMARLDRLEGVPIHYQRRTVEVRTASGEILNTEMYVVTDRTPSASRAASVNVNGNYEWRPA